MDLKYKVIILLLISINTYVIFDWVTFYKLNQGHYSSLVQDINEDSYSLTQAQLKISGDTITMLIRNKTPNNTCDNSYITATYHYNQNFLSKYVMLSKGQVTANHQQKSCRVKAYNEFARILGFGTNHRLSIIKDSSGDTCFRSQQLGTYCFGVSDD